MALKTQQMQTDLKKFRANWDEVFKKDEHTKAAQAGKQLLSKPDNICLTEYIQGV